MVKGLNNPYMVYNSEIRNIDPTNNKCLRSEKLSVKHTQLKLPLHSNQALKYPQVNPTSEIFSNRLTEKVSSTSPNYNQVLNRKHQNNFNNSNTSHFKAQNKLMILHQNIRGLRSKTNEILAHFSSELPSILCFTEHHLVGPELQTVCIDNYSLCAYYCRKHFSKGGVCIYVQKGLSISPINLDKFCIDKDIEICATQLHMFDTKICILSVYRSPTGDFMNFMTHLENSLQFLYNQHTDIIICGDININYLLESNRLKQLNALLQTYNLSNTIKFPTRIARTSSTAIDAIFIDTSKYDNFNASSLSNGLSDHEAQLITIVKLSNQDHGHMKQAYRKINEATINDFLYQLSHETWNHVIGGKDVNLTFNSFLNLFLINFNSCFPVTYRESSKKGKFKPFWITKGIKVSCKRKRELYMLTKNNDDVSVKLHYKTYCKILSRVITAAKKMSYDKYINKSQNKMKTTWKIINSETGRNINSSSTQQLIESYKDQNVAEYLNEHFVSIADNLVNQLEKNDTSYTDADFKSFMEQAVLKNYPKISCKPSTIKEIETIIKSIKTKDSYGYDHISTRVLKMCAPYISSPLNYICNMIIFSGKYPDRLKYSEIKPLYKKGDKSQLKNYRPISLLTAFSKVIENVMLRRLRDHLDKYNILSLNQFGFQRNVTIDDAVYDLLNEIQTAFNNQLKIKGIFCDIEKAFDCVNHDILINKLEAYGITGNSKKLFTQYLKDRYQRVIIKDSSTHKILISKWAKILHGVPQGSVLGPLLFLIYINDLPLSIDKIATPVLFADDTSILVADKNADILTSKLQSAFQTLNNWFRSNLLTINFSKTHSMQFITKNSRPIENRTYIMSHELTEVSHISFLGLEIDNLLSWNLHIDKVMKKLTSVCFMLRAAKPFISPASLLTVYYSLFHSALSYGIIFWGQSPSTQRLFVLQKRAIRIMMGVSNRTSCRHIFKKLEILPLNSQYIYSMLLFVSTHKQLFITNSDSHSIHTRQRDNLHVPMASLTAFQKGVYFSGVKIFNRLPAELKQLSSRPKQFKIASKRYLASHCFYTLDEFMTE
jgi:exonuclease III